MNGSNNLSAGMIGDQANAQNTYNNTQLNSGYLYPHYTGGYYIPSINDFSIRKVNNGFLLNKSGNEYVFETVEALVKHIQEHYKEKE